MPVENFKCHIRNLHVLKRIPYDFESLLCILDHFRRLKSPWKASHSPQKGQKWVNLTGIADLWDRKYRSEFLSTKFELPGQFYPYKPVFNIFHKNDPKFPGGYYFWGGQKKTHLSPRYDIFHFEIQFSLCGSQNHPLKTG